MMRFGWTNNNGFTGFGMMGGFGGYMMVFFMIVVLALAILGIVVILKFIRSPEGPGDISGERIDQVMPDGRVLQILNEQYASGIISNEDYTAKKEMLMKY